MPGLGTSFGRGGATTAQQDLANSDAILIMFIFRGEPDEYNLPAHPDVPTVHLRTGWTSAAFAAALMVVGTVFAFAGPRE